MIELGEGQSAIFGYGSLLSIASLERTLGRVYSGVFLPCAIEGWRRTWDAAMPNRTFYTDTPDGRLYPDTILYLNVRRDPGQRLNGILFVVDARELAMYDRRESIYDRVDVTGDLDVRVAGGSAYVYVCRPEHCLSDVASSQQGAIRSSYLAIVDTGLTQLGPEFRALYERSSDPAPSRLVIQDRIDSL